VAQHNPTVAQIAQACGVGRWTVFNYVRRSQEGGVAALLASGYAGRTPRGRVAEATASEPRGKLEQGGFKHAKEARAWLAGRGVELALKMV
jgi:transposase